MVAPHRHRRCGSQDCKMTVWATNRPNPCASSRPVSRRAWWTCAGPRRVQPHRVLHGRDGCVFTFEGAELGDAMSEGATRASSPGVRRPPQTRGSHPRGSQPIEVHAADDADEIPGAAALANGAAAANDATLPAPAVAADAGTGQAKAPKRIAPQAMGAAAAAANGSANVNAAPGPRPRRARAAPGPPSTAPTASMQTETAR